MKLRTACAFALLIGSASFAYAAPCAKLTRTYSFPLGEPVLAVCCDEESPPVVAQMFQLQATAPGTVGAAPVSAAPEIGPGVEEERADPALEFAKEIDQSFASGNSTCKRFDTLSAREKLAAKISGVPGGSCRVIATQYDHFICQCTQECGDVEWACNCPGVLPGSLPAAAPESFPQDSYRSRPELTGESCTNCSPGSDCCN